MAATKRIGSRATRASRAKCRNRSEAGAASGLGSTGRAENAHRALSQALCCPLPPSRVQPKNLQHPGLRRLLEGLYGLQAEGKSPTLDMLRDRIDEPRLIAKALEWQERQLIERRPACAGLEMIVQEFRRKKTDCSTRSKELKKPSGMPTSITLTALEFVAAAAESDSDESNPGVSSSQTPRLEVEEGLMDLKADEEPEALLDSGKERGLHLLTGRLTITFLTTPSIQKKLDQLLLILEEHGIELIDESEAEERRGCPG